jgi:hypothetical protein
MMKTTKEYDDAENASDELEEMQKNHELMALLQQRAQETNTVSIYQVRNILELE